MKSTPVCVKGGSSETRSSGKLGDAGSENGVPSTSLRVTHFGTILFLSQFFKFKLVSSTLRTCSCKTCLFSYAFRLTIVDFFREFYKQMLNACI